MKKYRTLLLGLAVLLITFSLFVGLPAILPPLAKVNCDAFWCRAKVLEYDTWFWDTPELPDLEALADNLRFEPVESEGILDGLRLISFEGPTGKLSITEDPENENRVIISGYLQYGTSTLSENVTDVGILRVPEFEGYHSGATVYIYFTDVIQTEKGNRYKGITFYKTTDETGRFSVSVEPQGYCFWIDARYEGELLTTRNPMVYYYPSKVSYSTCEVEYRKRFSWWIIVVAVLVLAGLSWALYRYLKNRHKPVVFHGRLSVAEEVPEEKAMKKTLPEKGGDTSLVEIIVSGIEESMPSVWEANTTLSIHITFRDRHGKELPSVTGSIDFGDGKVIQVTSNENGTISENHAYTRTGEYTITAGYRDKAGREVSSWRKIRIVDYREEMVRLFREMLEELNLSYIAIEPDMTPREVERLLSERLENVSTESIGKVIDGFEKANYSTHPVNRESYVRMYRAIREITQRND